MNRTKRNICDTFKKYLLDKKNVCNICDKKVSQCDVFVLKVSQPKPHCLVGFLHKKGLL